MALKQTFIAYKIFTVGVRTKSVLRTTTFDLWLFYKGVS